MVTVVRYGVQNDSLLFPVAGLAGERLLPSTAWSRFACPLSVNPIGRACHEPHAELRRRPDPPFASAAGPTLSPRPQCQDTAGTAPDRLLPVGGGAEVAWRSGCHRVRR